jgi:hypothetical protein
MSAPHLPPVGPDATTPLQLQVTTVSALTTDSIFVDLTVDSGRGEDAELLSLTSIFHCPLSKKVPTARMERCPGYARGVVKSSRQGINHGHLSMC